jgi:hypothetical protein
MSRHWLLAALLPAGLLSVAAIGRAQKPATPPAKAENIEAALKLTQAAAREYEFRVGSDEKAKPLELQKEPVLKWSNPEVGDIHGNVFLWTREGRPLVVACLFQWFSPVAAMEHEFHSLAEDPLTAKFHGKQVWETSEAGLKFVDVPKAPAPAATEAQRLVQLKQLSKEFTAIGKYRKDPNDIELRLLPQPIYRYDSPKQDIVCGGLFAFVQGTTDPDIFLLIEARGKDAASARWQFAAARMHSVADLRLRHQDKQIWEAESFTFNDIFEKHNRIYTSFKFKDVPEFLKDAVKPKP